MIKAQFENINPSPTTSFLVKFFHLEKFTVPYHFHPEYELTLIIRGNGKRYVGKNMEDYSDGDLVFLGADLPHCWKSGDQIDGDYVQSIVVQFEKNFLGEHFFNRPELLHIQELMKQSAFGIRFAQSVSDEIKIKMERLVSEESSFHRLSQLLDILNYLAISDDFTLLNNDGILASPHNTNKERMNTALGYIVDNFRNEILLDHVAAAVNMSPNAFCKYFKRTTSKTFMETVIEYRINFAIQQLLSTDKSVSDIAFESGFGDVSHFHKVFKRTMKTSPLDYRKNFQRGL
jgi:AraC-like DNA-binding protein